MSYRVVATDQLIRCSRRIGIKQYEIDETLRYLRSDRRGVDRLFNYFSSNPYSDPEAHSYSDAESHSYSDAESHRYSDAESHRYSDSRPHSGSKQVPHPHSGPEC
jgi:hypothetical protein